MSIASLCTGDTVTLQLQTTTQGSSFGSSITYAAVTGKTNINCRVDNPSASESLKYKSRAESFTHRVFFSADLGIQNNGPEYRLKWTKSNGNKTTLSPVRFLRVVDYNRHFDPSGRLNLWYADCNEETARQDS